MYYFILLVSFGFCATINYDGFKVYKVIARSDSENEDFRRLESNPDFDFWTRINRRGIPVSVMVAPKSQNLFENYLKTHKIRFGVEIQNVGEAVGADRQRYYRLPRKFLDDGDVTFDRYLRHVEMNDYLINLSKKYPYTVTIKSIGQSYEKRSMIIVKISSGTRKPPKPVIFVDAGIHAREWIAPPVALYLINRLVENPENGYLLEDVDWIILPCLNPDGYEYSWEKNRLWRKTISPGKKCNGTDANRNFDFHWMKSGPDSDECSNTYPGKKPFSEVETRNLRDFILNGTENIKAYLTLHSIGSQILYPWSYNKSLCKNWKELDDLGHTMANAIVAAGGDMYFVGATGRDLYIAAGTSDDWSMGVAGIDIVLTMELPGGGSFGFNMPENQIQGVVEQTFAGFKILGDYVAKNSKKIIV